tara:strand:- start:631 stop:1326 length:696 start_codon:yes stop_codon:yes gene_type:complete
MSKDPAFLFYSSDFLTGVSDLTMEERGQFITLLCLQHQKGHLTKKVMQLQCHGTPTADVLAKFRIDENGLYYNERVEQEREKRAAHSVKQRENALKRWNKNKSSTKQTLSNGNATAMPLENENENEDVNEIIVEIYPAFSDFWNLYDKKIGSRDKIEKKWNSITQKTKEQIIDYLPAYLEATPDKTYRKNPQTFLNNKSWEDEIINKTKNNGSQTDYSSLQRKAFEKIQSS